MKIKHGFVDHADFWDIIIDSISTITIIQCFQARAQFWKKLIFSMVGKLTLRNAVGT